jgi:hypothetical protein
MRALCAGEPGPGVLAYVDSETAGWCSVAPKSTYRALVNSRTIPHVVRYPQLCPQQGRHTMRRANLVAARRLVNPGGGVEFPRFEARHD